MPTPPDLLNADGSASMATMLMMSHHGFRRDLRRFEIALKGIADGDVSKLAPLREEWGSFRATLHGHHEAEDKGIFPDLSTHQESLRPTIERLTGDHRRIDPLLDRGDRAFAELPETEPAAAAIVAELAALLEPHLATEEAEVIPFLRDAKGFPPPASDAEVELYAQGFAWASQGIAPQVLKLVYAMLPESLTSRLPAARTAFDTRCTRVWGSAAAGASTTPIPDR